MCVYNLTKDDHPRITEMSGVNWPPSKGQLQCYVMQWRVGGAKFPDKMCFVTLEWPLYRVNEIVSRLECWKHHKK